MSGTRTIGETNARQARRVADALAYQPQGREPVTRIVTVQCRARSLDVPTPAQNPSSPDPAMALGQRINRRLCSLFMPLVTVARYACQSSRNMR